MGRGRLHGAAREAYLNKRARQLSTETQKQTQSPIQAELNQIDSQVPQHHVSVDQSREKSCYTRKLPPTIKQH